MDQYLGILQKSVFFQGLDLDEIQNILLQAKHRVKSYSKDALIASEGDNCDQLGIILSGKIEVQKIYSSGKTVTMARFQEGNLFGDAIIFSNHHLYPGTIISYTSSKILFLPKATVLSLCQDFPLILENFMKLLSERVLLLNKKITQLSLGTIRQKISYYLLEEYQKQKSHHIRLKMSKERLAEHMGIQRPSLSRELMKMRDSGLIDFSTKYIIIKSIDALEASLQE